MIQIITKLYSTNNYGWSRLLGMILGNILLGIGIGIFKVSTTGNDPFSAMIFSLHMYTPLMYALFLIIVNTFIFIIQWIFGREYIGLGTIINWFLVGFVVQYTILIFEIFLGSVMIFAFKILLVIFGLVIASLGLSLYQSADAGVAPYDSLSLIMSERCNLSYFLCRMILDGTCVLIAFIAGGVIGLGTVITMFGFGPSISFFNKHVANKLYGV